MPANTGAADEPAPGAAAGVCPECGAPATAGLTCWELLCAILAWEWEDPALQAQHFLTVASYNLQHPAQFTGEALAGLRELFIAHLEQGTEIAELRRRVGRMAEGNRRVLKPEHERRPVLRCWRVTIADVYQAGQPEGAAARVQRWAAAIRDELTG